MSQPYFQTIAVTAAASLLLVFTACLGSVNHKPGETRTESKSVELPKAEIVHAEISMAAGDLKLRGGATKLLDGDFRSNVDSWRPEVKYEESGLRGQLTVRQHEGGRMGGDTVNEWTIRLNDKTPLDLEVKVGAGEAHLDLGGLTLRTVNVKMGAGESEILLGPEPKRGYDLNVRGGVGEATIRIPKNVGVIAHAAGGLGGIDVKNMTKDGDSYINEAYGKAKVTVRVDVKGGVGQINLLSE